MNAIKRSESPGRTTGSCQPLAGGKLEQASGGGGGGGADVTCSERAEQSPAAVSNLKFGLNARANKAKYDENAGRRLRGSARAPSAQQAEVVNAELAAQPLAPKTSTTNTKRPVLSQSKQQEAHQILVAMNGAGSGAASGTARQPMRGSKYGNFYKPQDLLGEPQGALSGANELATGDNKQQQQAVQQQQALNKQVRARSKSPVHNQRRKSLEEKRADAPATVSATEPKQNKEAAQQQQVVQVAKTRAQFNVLPPPQLAIATTGRGSVISYAKSRIYDKPARPILSNPPLIVGNNCGDVCADSPSSLVFAVGDIPQSILSGRKPPKQVNVSRARKEWEGGEPFAKCRSRKRLAAAQRNKNKLLIHESWSMASVVATQQLQLQQALAAANAKHTSNIQQSDPSVKVLTRGSVLERVQQFERVPSSASLSSSVSSSSLASSTSCEQDEEHDLESAASLTIDESGPRPLSPGAGKQAVYRNKVSIIQHQQQQQAVPALHKPLTRSSSTSASNERKRKLSLRRGSSLLASKEASSAALIPKFYHPQGTKPNTYEIELEKRNIVACFDRFPERRAQLVGPNAKRHLHAIALACGLSEYYKIPLQRYVKHQLDKRPELSDETSASYASLRRRSSLTPLNPNNLGPTMVAQNGVSSSGAQSKMARPLERSSSKEMRADKLAIKSNGTREGKASNLLQKSASIDSGKANDNKEETSNKVEYVNCEQFLACWKELISVAYDTAARFTHLLTMGQRNYLLPDDFVPLVQSIIDDHPGLKFLRAAPDFHMRYIQTVIARIYYCVNKSWTGKIKLQELRRSNFLAVLQVLSQEEDINLITDYFSYEHFYVIYCKFWSLDQDHDLLISKEDLARHNDAAISSRIIERVFSGTVSKQIAKTGKMSYSDFVWFLIAEEDKKHPRSVEYWFRLMDLDGDGFISMYELEYFYYEQMKRLELMNIEALPFLDTACQILDLVNPKYKNKISLADLKATKMATIFFDTFINLEKYLEHESREFVSTRDIVQDGVIISDWDRYASEEYENMVTEETSV